MGIWRQHDIGIDLGTSKFALCVRGEGIVATEPALIIFRDNETRASSVVAFGHEALRLLEASGPSPTKSFLRVVRPMRAGVVVDPAAARLLLQAIARGARMHWGFGRASTVITHLLGASDAERLLSLDVASSLGKSRVISISEPLAAAHAIDVDLSENYANFIIDIGEGATEAVIIRGGKIFKGQTLRLGGAAINEAIIIHLIRDMLSSLTDSVMVELIENGLYLCGGVSLKIGLAEAIHQATGLDVHILARPEAAVIRGLVNLLPYASLLS